MATSGHRPVAHQNAPAITRRSLTSLLHFGSLQNFLHNFLTTRPGHAPRQDTFRSAEGPVTVAWGRTRGWYFSWATSSTLASDWNRLRFWHMPQSRPRWLTASGPAAAAGTQVPYGAAPSSARRPEETEPWGRSPRRGRRRAAIKLVLLSLHSSHKWHSIRPLNGLAIAADPELGLLTIC